MEHLFAQNFAIILALVTFSQWASWHLRIPSIVFFLFFGVMAGPSGFGLIQLNAQFNELVNVLVKFALAIVLFEGGLRLQYFEFRRVGHLINRLLLIGAPLIWFLGTLAAFYLLDFSLAVSATLSAILIVTGPTVIIPMMRNVHLPQRLAYVFKWEGIINDPLGVLIALFMARFFIQRSQGFPIIDVFVNMFSGIIAALLIAVGCAFAVKIAFERQQVPEYLKVSFITAIVIIMFIVCNAIHSETGLLAVTAFGIALGNLNLVVVDELKRFKEYLSVFLVSSVFVVLTAQLELNQLKLIGWSALLFSALLILVIRPLSVWISTIGSGLKNNERVLLGFIGPKGVVVATMAEVFARDLGDAGFEDAHLITPTAFAMIAASVFTNGLSFNWLASRLKLSSDKKGGLLIVGGADWGIAFASALKDFGIPVLYADTNWQFIRRARLKGLRVFFGDLLSEHGYQKLDLSGLENLLAATENDAYNSHICTQFAKHMDSERVFQLPLHSVPGDSRHSPKRALRGRIAFSETDVFEQLLLLLHRGWVFKIQKVEKETTLKDVAKENEKEAVPILLIDQAQDIHFFKENKETQAKEGDHIVLFTKAEAQK